MPTFPKNDPPLSREGSLNEIIASIAAEELSLSHILNTQGENLQYVLGTLPGLDEAASQDEVLRINQSVKDTLPGVFISKQPDKAYGGLVTSIQANGVREPVILRLREDGEYQLVTGYRRYRASELAKRQDIPALVYEMTPQEAVNYRRQVQSKPDFPVPGKLVEPSVLDSKPQKPDIKGTENPTAGPQEMDKPKEAPTPATPAKDGKAQDTGTKAAGTPTAPAAEDKPKEAPAPAVPAKDSKSQDTGTKAIGTPTAPTAGDKPKEAPTPADPARDGKAQDTGIKATGTPTTPTAGDKPKEAPAPVDHAKDSKTQDTGTKAAETPTAPAAGDKPKEAQAPADPAKDGKTQDTGTKAAETPTAPAAGDKPKEAQAPADPAKDGKALDTGTKAAETPAAPTAGDKPKETPTAVPGHVARGPAGTAISQIFDERLTPPDEKAKHDIPSPRDDDSFFILLHPAYLQKSKYNTVSVDQQSEDYRELKKSIELNGVKDPVLARNGDEGTLEILSGQRRHMIATELNYPVPTIIQKISDADAKILVADGNLHRPHISAYDLSRSLRMKMEGMKQKSGRRKKGTFKAEELDSDVKLAEIEKLLNWIDVFTWYVNVNARTWAELEADFQAWSDMDGLTWVQVQVREMVIEDLVASWNVFDPRYPRGVRL